ncbi:MAG: signal recognition particle-docking protein FtsY [Bacilli bacterium]|jgi:fused signal recognition particle receptor
MGIFSKIKEKLLGTKVEQNEKYVQALDKSRNTFKGRINALLSRYRKVDEEYFESLEELLIKADVGASLALEIVEEVKSEARLRKINDPSLIMEILVDKMFIAYSRDLDLETKINFAEQGPTVIVMMGVNGSGKTTSIAKLSYKLQKEGHKILWVAGDTFRAGAVEQLAVWASRVGVKLHSGEVNADPSSVIYDGVKKAVEEGYDVVICDTAGRLQTKTNLMNEAAKMIRVIKKVVPKGPQEIFLVIDATTGQNGVYQAKAFAETTGITGIILTKMDGTSKGGIILAIRDQLGIPVRYIGLGEKLDDLEEFDLLQYLNALVGVEKE